MNLVHCLIVIRRFASQEVEVDSEDQEHERLHAVTDLDNKASRNVLQKCGFTFGGEGESHGRKDARYYLEAPTV